MLVLKRGRETQRDTERDTVRQRQTDRQTDTDRETKRDSFPLKNTSIINPASCIQLNKYPFSTLRN